MIYHLTNIKLSIKQIVTMITIIIIYLLQDFILEHYSEDGENYEEAIAELMETRQVNK